MSLKSRNRGTEMTERLSLRREDWCTPDTILDPLHVVFGRIALDPCDNPYSSTDALVSLQLEQYRAVPRVDPTGTGRVVYVEDSLNEDWGRYITSPLTASTASVPLVYVNYPFGLSTNPRWVGKVEEEVRTARHRTAFALLLPAAVGSKWWTPVWNADGIFFPRRQRFVGAPNTADFDVALAVWCDLDAAMQLRNQMVHTAHAVIQGRGAFPRGRRA